MSFCSHFLNFKVATKAPCAGQYLVFQPCETCEDRENYRNQKNTDRWEPLKRLGERERPVPGCEFFQILSNGDWNSILHPGKNEAWEYTTWLLRFLRSDSQTVSLCSFRIWEHQVIALIQSRSFEWERGVSKSWKLSALKHCLKSFARQGWMCLPREVGWGSCRSLVVCQLRQLWIVVKPSELIQLSIQDQSIDRKIQNDSRSWNGPPKLHNLDRSLRLGQLQSLPCSRNLFVENYPSKFINEIVRTSPSIRQSLPVLIWHCWTEWDSPFEPLCEIGTKSEVWLWTGNRGMIFPHNWHNQTRSWDRCCRLAGQRPWTKPAGFGEQHWLTLGMQSFSGEVVVSVATLPGG